MIKIKISLFLFAIIATGCAAFQNHHCKIEKQLLNAVGIGLAATDAAIGQTGGDEYETAMKAARGVQLLGREAIRACELARDGAAWHQWVMLALETVGAVVGIIEGANEEISGPAPPELHNAIERLRHESNQIITLAQ